MWSPYYKSILSVSGWDQATLKSPFRKEEGPEGCVQKLINCLKFTVMKKLYVSNDTGSVRMFKKQLDGSFVKESIF